MGRITQISAGRTGMFLRLDDAEDYWLSRRDVAEGGYREGQEVDMEAFVQFVRLRQYPRALEQAAAMLARRACSSGEIETRLRRHRYMDEVVELVLYKLEKEKLLDDRAFCAQWVRYRSGMKFGSRRIRQELKQKGLPEELIREALDELDREEEWRQALSLAEKAWQRRKAADSHWKARQKVTAALVRRGFGWEVARRAAEAAANGTEDTK